MFGYARYAKYALLVFALFFTACDKPDVRGSFAFIDFEGFDGIHNVASGFMTDSGYIVTAAHVADKGNIFFLTNMDGEKTDAFVSHIEDGADIAYLLPMDDIWDEHLEVGTPSEDDKASSFWGCFSGREEDGIMITVCSFASLVDQVINFVGKTAKGGMSGGPCFGSDGETVIGVVSSSKKGASVEHDEHGTVGLTHCDTFDKTWDYFFGW